MSKSTDYNKLALLCLSLLLFLSCFGGMQPVLVSNGGTVEGRVSKSDPIPLVKEGYGLVFILHPGQLGFMDYNFEVVIDDAAVGRLGKKSYIYAHLSPGNHVVMAYDFTGGSRSEGSEANTPPLSISVDNGETIHLAIMHVRQFTSTTPSRQALGMPPLIKDEFRLEDIGSERGKHMLQAIRGDK